MDNRVVILLIAFATITNAVGNCPGSSQCLPLKECQLDDSSILYSCDDGKICCEPKPPKLTAVSKLSAQERTNTINALMEKCGEGTMPRIGRGKNAGIDQFPWMALLGSVHPPSKRHFYCGGTLISQRHILTAAHCINTPNGIVKSVRLGENNLDTRIDIEIVAGTEVKSDEPVDIPVESATIHEEFNNVTLKHDIALLRLAQNVNYTDFIKPICLPFLLKLNDYSYRNRSFFIAGWGRTKSSTRVGSTILQYAKLRELDPDTCNKTVAPEKRPITKYQVCVLGLGGEDACKGDSGGPLMNYTVVNFAGFENELKAFQIGIVSSGLGASCGDSGHPSIHTRVEHYTDWILSKMFAT